MNLLTIDSAALLRAIGISIGCGLILMALAYLITRKRKDWGKIITMIMMGILGILILTTIIIYNLWPSLVSTPVLDNKSKDEAEQVLIKNNLVPDGKPMYSSTIEKDRVIPNSQDPKPGIRVNPGTIVAYRFSIKIDSASNGYDKKISFDFTSPQSNGTVHCTHNSNGSGTLSISGVSKNIVNAGYGLLIWIRPVHPPSDVDGWYLQRPPDGVRFENDGSWTGEGQIGNKNYPPHENDIVDIAVTCLDKNAISNLMAKPDVVIESWPIGGSVNIHKNLKVSFKNQ